MKASTLLLWVLAQLLSASSVLAEQPPNRLTLYFMPTTPVGLNWDSPRALLRSAVLGAIWNRNHPIGHAVVEGACEPIEENGPPIRFATGATSESGAGSTRLLLGDRVAFGILTRAWAGRLEQRPEIERDLKKRSERFEDLSAVTFVLSRESCHRMLDYHQWIQQSPYPRYYGFAARPRYLEGGGCSAFAASYAEVAGVLSPRLRSAWSRTVKIPRGLVARPELGERLGISSALISSLSRRWALETEPHVALDLFDPDLMHAWAVASWRDARGFNTIRDEALIERFKKSFGNLPALGPPHESISMPARRRRFAAVLIDARSMPAPTEPVILGEPDPARMDGSLEKVP